MRSGRFLAVGLSVAVLAVGGCSNSKNSPTASRTSACQYFTEALNTRADDPNRMISLMTKAENEAAQAGDVQLNQDLVTAQEEFQNPVAGYGRTDVEKVTADCDSG